MQNSADEFKWQEWKNNPFELENLVLLNCRGDGNCQFTSIANCLKEDLGHGHDLNGDFMRKLAAHEVLNSPASEVKFWVDSYCMEAMGELDSGTGRYVEKNDGNIDLHILLANANHIIKKLYNAGTLCIDADLNKDDFFKFAKISRLELWKQVSNKKEMVVKTYNLRNY